jgi:hypothetical protein
MPANPRILGVEVETAGFEPARQFPREAEGLKPPICRQLALPLRDRTGATIAFVVIDEQDAILADQRWYLDSDPERGYGKPYARRNGEVDGRRVAVYLHREVLGLPHGDKRQVDHINGLTLDNRRANLRIVTHAEQAQNRRKRSATSSRYRGVTWDRSREKWLASATVNGRRTTVGRFESEDEAGAAVAAWRAEHMPFSQEAA